MASATIAGWTRAAWLTGAMLDAATAADWDHVATLEAEREVLLADPALADAVAHCDPTMQAELAELIRGIGTTDARIVALAEAARAEVGAQLASAGNVRRLRHAYEPD
ncbi:MAG: flagellar protein FliT [Burkholderiales bacterium]|jgi:enoyl-CoA hydratase/carnithine racemase|nr:flagellar protein FliT [Burkholderiales bacterium]